MYGVIQPGFQLRLHQLDDVVIPESISGLGFQAHCMDGKEAEYLWQGLKDSIQSIQRKHYSNLSFEELYRHGYYLIKDKHGAMLYTELCNVIASHITHKVQSKILANFDKNFLRTLNNSWDHHQTSISMIRDILLYMDNYVRQNRLEDINTLGLNIFKNLVVCHSSIQTHLQNILLGLVMKERHGEQVERTTFRCATKMLKDMSKDGEHVYQEIFETPFLEESTHFFRLESQNLLEENNVSLYLRRVERRISEETERSYCCYDETTAPKITLVVEYELIKAHMKVIVEMKNSGVVHMIQNQLTDDLVYMYKLLGRVPEGLKTMFDCISNHVREQGQVIVRDEESNDNALIYVQSLLDLKDKIDFYLVNSFSSDKLFQQTIASDFEFILNLNYRSPEFLSLFIDEQLKKAVRGHMIEDERKVLLDKTMVLFRFLQDKDLFEQYYKQHLAKRLIISKTINEENEKAVIMKLKAECGLQYTYKLEGMFKDIWISSALTDEFRKQITVTKDPVHGVDIFMRILTTVNWPTQKVPPCNLPLAPLTAFESFRKFYLSKHCGRQLTLLPQLGSAELEAYFVHPHCRDDKEWETGLTSQIMRCGEMRSYTLQVSTYQMCVLMLFNNQFKWNSEELQVVTNIPPKDLNRALQSLTMGKPSQRVLIKKPDSHKIETTDFFYVNTKFTSKTNRVKIPPFQMKYETESERQDTIRRVNEDRNHEVEAAIIRVVKARKVVDYENLMNEVMAILSSRFLPSRALVKTSIEVLIEKEYIARNSEDRRIFEYIG